MMTPMKKIGVFLYVALAGFITAVFYLGHVGKSHNKPFHLTNESSSNREVQLKHVNGHVPRESTNNNRGSSTNQQQKGRNGFVIPKHVQLLTRSTEIHAHEYNKVGEPKLLLFNKSKCSASPGDQTTLLYVYSSPKNILQRDFIRNTYGSETLFAKYNLRTVFVIGLQLPGFNITDQIIEEHVMHQDLVIGAFVESYRNLARKGLAALNFLHNWCKNAKFVIKTDDDIIIAPKIILQMLYTDFVNGHRLIIGRKLTRYKPIRCKPWTQWCVGPDVYNKTYYPPYVVGVAFAFTYDLVADMYDESVRVPLLPLDDAYFTGILVENLNKTFIDLGEKLVSDLGYKALGRIKARDKTIVGHTRGLDQMKIAWEIFNENKTVNIPRIGVDFEVTTPMSKHKDNTVV